MSVSRDDSTAEFITSVTLKMAEIVNLVNLVYGHVNGNRPRVWERLDNIDLLKRYRFDNAGIQYLDELFGHNLERKSPQNYPLTPEQQICAALLFYTCGSWWKSWGDKGIYPPMFWTEGG